MLFGKYAPIVTVFKSKYLKDTDSVFYKNGSFGKKQKDGSFVNENWTLRSFNKDFKDIPDGTRIRLDFVDVDNGSYKKDDEWKQTSPKVTVIEFSVVEKDAATKEEAPVDTTTEEDSW